MTEEARKLGNQPAFPMNRANNNETMGLTKREYFAGLAMQGMTKSINLKAVTNQEARDNNILIHNIGNLSCQVADILLEELSKTE